MVPVPSLSVVYEVTVMAKAITAILAYPMLARMRRKIEPKWSQLFRRLKKLKRLQTSYLSDKNV